MKNRNICKFTCGSEQSSLITTRFIFEAENKEDGYDQILNDDRMVLVTDGCGRLTVDNKDYEISKGYLIFLFTGQLVKFNGKSDMQYMYITFRGERANELYQRYGITYDRFIFPDLKSLIPIWKESLNRAVVENIDLLSESMLLYAFSRLDKCRMDSPDTIHIVTEYLSENYSDRQLTLQSMAEELGYNEKYLSHLITVKTGVNFSNHLRELRLRQAVLLIGQGVTSVKNISILCGFSDPLYFSKVFRAKFDMSPKEFIEKHTKSDI